MTEELKDCPFCGCKATFVKHSAGMPGTMGHDRWDAVACKHCRATVGACDRRFREKDDAAAAWNRRAPYARDARIAELEAKLASNSPHDPGQAAIATLQGMGYEHRGGVLWAPPVGKAPKWLDSAEPSTPWYPDDSGEWVEVPEGLMEMPSALSPETRIEGLTRDEREGELYTYCNAHAKHWPWFLESHSDNRIVAYKVVKP